MIKHLWLFVLCCFCFVTTSFADKTFLPANQAFQVRGEILSPKQFVLVWKIADNYHLYSDSLSIRVLTPSSVKLASWALPPGVKGTDPNRAHPYEEYYHRLSIPITLTTGTTTGLSLMVSYQGCADAGLCYPPQIRTIMLSETSLNQLTAVISDSHDANRISDLLKNQKPWIILLGFFIFGLLLAFTPCVFPMLPILSSIIVGHGHRITTTRAFLFSLIYVLAGAMTYAAAGIFAGFAGHYLQAALQNPWIIGFSGIFFIVLAMSLFGFYELQLPSWLQNKLMQLNHPEKHSALVNAGLMGIFSTLVVSPCVSAPLVGGLAYIGESGNPVFGGIALFMMGLGIGFPLLAVGTSAGKLLPKAGGWMENIKKLFGVLLLGMAIWLWSRVLSAPWTLALSGILAASCAIYLCKIKKSFWKISGCIVGLYGVCLLAGAISGGKNIFQPLDQFTQKYSINASPNSATSTVKWIPIKNLSELQRARQKSQPALLDFYADWCASCHEMDQTVFNDPLVKKAFKKNHMQLLRVDLTTQNPDLESILKKYNVVGPPTILFFDSNGKWLPNATTVGGQSVDEFLKSLSQIRATSLKISLNNNTNEDTSMSKPPPLR